MGIAASSPSTKVLSVLPSRGDQPRSADAGLIISSAANFSEDVTKSTEVDSNTAPFSPVWKKLIEHLSNPSASPYKLMELLFRIEERGSTVWTEVRAGFVHFLSVALILGVNPQQLAVAGYDKQSVAAATALSCGFSCVLTGLICNFPFLVTPTLSTGIYLSAYIQSTNLSTVAANTAVFCFGILVVFCSIRSVTDFISIVIPYSIKKGVVIGLSLLITLRALIQLQLIVPNTENVLGLGNVWSPGILIAIGAVVLIGCSLHYELQGWVIDRHYYCIDHSTSIVYLISNHLPRRFPSLSEPM